MAIIGLHFADKAVITVIVLVVLLNDMMVMAAPASGSGLTSHEQGKHEILPRTRKRASTHFDIDFDGDIFSSRRNFGLTCLICIVMDSEFSATVYSQQNFSELYRLIDYVSWIFRSNDWNGDGMPDNIGFTSKIIATNWNPHSVDLRPSPLLLQDSMEMMMMRMGELDFSSCCLGLGLTMKQFRHVSKVGTTFNVNDRVGGLCNRSPSILTYNGRLSAGKLFSNTILISGRGLSENVKLLQFPDMIRILIHELGHAFGITMHDNDIKLSTESENRVAECFGHDSNSFMSTATVPKQNESVSNYDPLNHESPRGRYVMWARAPTTKTSTSDVGVSGGRGSRNSLRPNNLLFSPCSKEQITRFLAERKHALAKCLLVDAAASPFCGNGIVEEPEECDCGNELNCRQDPCCGSRSSPNPCKFISGDHNRTCPVYTTYMKAETHAYPGKGQVLSSQQQENCILVSIFTFLFIFI